VVSTLGILLGGESSQAGQSYIQTSVEIAWEAGGVEFNRFLRLAEAVVGARFGAAAGTHLF
jgi:hypothetical protein